MAHTKSRKAKARPKRAYDSDLRRAQAGITAERILDAVHARLTKGDKTLSFAAIAREARVSVPTVYRHFPTQDDLFRAFAARTQQGVVAEAIDRAALPGVVRQFFARFDDPGDPLHGAGRLGTVWQFSRVGTIPRRRQLADRLLQDEAPHVPEPERTWLIDAIVVVFSSATGEAFRGYLERSGAETADRVALILDALLRRAVELSEQAVRTRGGR